MQDSHESAGDRGTGEVVSFDEALLDACPKALRAELLEEAAMLVQAFAPEGRPEQLTAMAKTLSYGLQGGRKIERIRGRRLAAALRRLAKAAS